VGFCSLRNLQGFTPSDFDLEDYLVKCSLFGRSVMNRVSATFILRRSISFLNVLVVVTLVTAAALYYYGIQKCRGIRAEIRQQIEIEIVQKHLQFPSNEAREI
jgi:hypothetical protein